MQPEHLADRPTPDRPAPDSPVRLGRRGLLTAAALAGAVPVWPTSATPAVADEAAGPGGTVALAAYGAGLRYEDIPAPALQRAKDCMTDAVATIVYGADLPWSRMIIDYVRATGAGGRSRILGTGPDPVTPAAAALAQGAMAHAFELDNLTKPDSGGHPGAVLFSAGLAVAQDRGAGGKALLTALVAGAEVMIRIGYATGHTDEERGFHAPSACGPFGGAITAGHLMGFDPTRMTNALGIAGSCSGGLLAFAHSGDGAMVKRFNLGRGAEGGVVAASLAARGFTGPSTVIEGEGGFLRAFCPKWDTAQLTDGLGHDFKTMTIMIKRYACHITAHTPVEAILDLRRQHGFAAGGGRGHRRRRQPPHGDRQQHPRAEGRAARPVQHPVLRGVWRCTATRSTRPPSTRRWSTTRRSPP